MVAHLKNLLITVALLSIVVSVPSNVHAVTPSPAMLAQFQKLPKAEQQRLMKQYGISPQMLNGGSANTGAQPIETPKIINERVDSKAFNQQFERDLQRANTEQEPKLKRYGYDMFEGEPTTFAPVSDIPVPFEYLMGPGDVVNIQTYGKENQSFSLAVSRSGTIDLPNTGPLSVIGLSFEKLQAQLSDKIEEQYTGVKANISLGELRSIRIIITGEAYKPGSYTVSSLSTITQALFVSGGVSDIASLRNIKLKRSGKTVVTFDLYDLLMKGDASKDKRLQSGDVIFIPPVAKSITVQGEVRRPAIYELKGNETVADAVKLAAGLKSNSFPKASVISRFSSDFLPVLVNVDLTQKGGQRAKMVDGDVLTVQSTTEKIKNQVIIAGSVNRPGFYQWRNGTRISDLLSSQWSDLKGETDLNYALLVREVNLQGDIETKQFSLARIFNDKNATDNFYLRPRDSLIVFSQIDSSEGDKDNETKDKLKRRTLLAGNTSNRESVEALNQQQLTPQYLDDEEQKSDEDLSQLYTKKELIKRSNKFTRRQLLTPIIDKLKSQDLVNGVTNVASVSGEVRFPGEYPISNQAHVSDLVRAAGGVKETAYLKQAELTKFSVSEELGATVSHQQVNLELALSNDVIANLKVESRDQLSILRIPSWQENMSVTLKGEVKFPGVYSVRDGETLDSVVKRAGGYTEQAFLSGAVFTRESVKEQELKQIIKFADQLRLDIAAKGLSGDTGVSFTEASLMLKELENLQAVGRMVVTLSQNSEESHNQLLVEDGDMLIIPPQKQTVTVVGEVQHASTHFYDEGFSFEQYVVKAGGIKQRADEDRTYIIRANGAVVIPEQQLWFSGKNQIKPGDTIVVPLDTEYKDNLTLWSQVTGIIYNAAVAIAAVNGI